ncbi:hypothetical protein LZG75_12045 [Polynucleobacter sp. IMCC30063]|uniref:hypothetical protein n=1 Tax=Polynucleobacter sp. IMCC30063 TaxID=2907298 RepID=UPI001F316D97|nr:hypothetical protein [Polynucleobacter sp. IMCC30063]MCE7506960.1 hypothetical protein [Polynucleobacter sp. IMCC30063]
MTQAICFKCGEGKFGAFTLCKACHTRPQSEDDLVKSLGLSDHHNSPSELTKLSLALKNGSSIQFEPNQKELLINEVHAFLQTPIGKMLTGQTVVTQQKKWWEFWK